MILQDVESLSQTDLLAPTLAVVEDLVGPAFSGPGRHRGVSFVPGGRGTRAIGGLFDR